LALCLPFLAGACTLPGTTPAERNAAVNRQLLSTLETRALSRVEDFDEDAYFDELEGLYADAPAAAVEPEAAVEPADLPPLNPYLTFGSRIWPAGDGYFVKPYSFPLGMAEDVKNLARIYGDFPVTDATGGSLPPVADQAPDSAVFELRAGFDAAPFNPPRGAAITSPAMVQLSDWIFVRARPEVLLEVERFFDLFSAHTRQIEIEAKVVEVTTSDSFDYGIRPVDGETPIFALPNPGSLINSVDYSFGNSVDQAEALFRLSSVFDGVEFNAILELVADHENVSIISRPKVAVREGGRAEIVNITRSPFFKIEGINSAGNFTTKMDWVEVGVQMYVIPRVIGEDTIILNIDIEVSQETGTAVSLTQGGGDDAATVSVPEVSTRIARTIVRLEPGQAVILGGLISEQTIERETGIPLLGDIPLLGYLFRNEFEETRQTNVLFFIRPRILQGIDFEGF